MTTRSPLGAIAYETGGVLVDHGWLRVLGSGHPRLTRQLGTWNKQLGIPLSDFLIVADDILGGVFAIDGGALGSVRGNVHYFAPDTLKWEPTELGYGAFLQWTFSGDLEKFYQDVRWPSWHDEIEGLDGDHALDLYPQLWTAEGKDISTTSRQPIPVAELWRLHIDIRAQLGRR